VRNAKLRSPGLIGNLVSVDQRDQPAASNVRNPYLAFQNLSKAFGPRFVLKDVSFAINSGETTCILGRSGTGKSVCLRLLMGFLKPTRGHVLAAGEDITKYSDRELERIHKRITMVFQSGALFDSLTVAENVAFPLRERMQMDESEISQIVDKLLFLVQSQEWRDALPDEISTGAKRLVAIARALAAQPETILYDEPTTNVDPITGRTVARLLLKLKQDMQLTNVVVTHDMRLVDAIADRVIFLDNGSVLFAGPKEEMNRTSIPLIRQFMELDLVDATSIGNTIAPRRLAS
jgi:phospholipid/cholesterol/gamma-HCH transport system ATP-binding protein